MNSAKFYKIVPKGIKVDDCAELILQSTNLISGLGKSKGGRKKRESSGETTRTTYKSRKYQFGFNLLSKY
jgi:hypothetical protein